MTVSNPTDNKYPDNRPKIIGVIPARGGSKGVPRKNIRKLLGKPLVAYTISPALKSKFLTKVVISSEDDEILEIGVKYGAYPVKRPMELAVDTAPTLPVIQHAVRYMEEKENTTYDYIMLLQPTTPLRTTEDIDNALKELMETGVDALISVVKVSGMHPVRMKRIENDTIMDFCYEEPEGARRQDLPDAYIRNGAIYAFKRETIMKNGTMMSARGAKPFFMPEDRSINIDSELDFILAETVMKKMDFSHVRPVNSFQLIWKSYYGNESIDLELPNEWMGGLQFAYMADSEKVRDEEFEKAILNPIGSPKLSEIVKKCVGVRGKEDTVNSEPESNENERTACIAIDDLTRPTQTYKILPLIIEEIKKGGIKEENIIILFSLGTHRAVTREEMVRKVGEDILRRFRVYNHNPYQNCAFAGKTSYGTELQINRFFLEADIKVCIGMLAPHPYAGFTGGGKMVLPGLASIDNITTNHKPANEELQGRIGEVEGNSRRAEIDEVARIVGVNFIVNTITNSKGETAGIFAGDPIIAFNEASKKAKKIYATDVPRKLDIGIFNAFPKDNFFLMSLNALNIWNSREKEKEIVKEGGTIVIINACSDGCGEHGLVGRGMKLHVRRDKHGTFKDILKGRRLIFYSPNINYGHIRDHYPPGVMLFNEWEGVVEELKKHHPNNPKIGVFPCASIQIDREIID